MGQGNLLTGLMLQLPGHTGSEHDVEHVAEPFAVCQRDRLLLPVTEMLEEVPVSGHYAVTPVAVAQ